MPDFKQHADHCRFYNCTHRQEPDCAVTAHVGSANDQADISESRYRIYNELFAELSETRY